LAAGDSLGGKVARDQTGTTPGNGRLQAQAGIGGLQMQLLSQRVVAAVNMLKYPGQGAGGS
jgi:hypothetical protein